MKKFILHIVLMLLICVVCSRCKHEPIPDRDCGEAQTIDEMMEWMYFKTGTYWIYEEQNTGTLDTMTVYFDYNGNSQGGFRDFVVKMRSSFDGFTYEYWFNDSYSGDCSLKPGCTCRAVDCEKYKPGHYAGGNHVFIFPLRVGSQVWQSGGGINFGESKIVEDIDSIELFGLSFQNIYVFQQEYSPQHNYDSSTYKICEHIGIIEKSIPEINENWFLVEYNILQ